MPLEDDKVNLCGGGCSGCPDATFREGGVVELCGDDGQQVTLTPYQLDKLYSEALRRRLAKEDRA
jgi:hypothetical protein